MAIRELETHPMPPRIAALPRDVRGYPIPWFVHVGEDGTPDFRVIGRDRHGRGKVGVAHAEQRCWVCGQPRGRNLAFLIGPMCAISRTTAEPPSHLDCAVFAAKVCPFMARPVMHRQEHKLPDDIQTAGMAIKRNPGIGCVWVTRSYRPFRSETVVGGTSGVLFRVGDPETVLWFREGEPAEPAAVWESIRTGLPALAAVAIMQGEDSLIALAHTTRSAARLVQPHGELPDLNAMVLEAARNAPPPEVARHLASIAAVKAAAAP